MRQSRGFTAPDRSKLQSREVNNLLHTLRGEDFRHERNQNRTSVARPPRYSVLDGKTLPIYDIFGDYEDPTHESARHEVLPFTSVEEKQQPEWRKQALSLLYSYAPLRTNGPSGSSPSSFVERNEDTSEEIPPLTVLCLRVLVTKYRGPSFGEDVVPYVPTHLRRVLLRWTAVFAPLSNARLYTLCDRDLGGHTEGELIVVGPYASLPMDYFKNIEMEMGRDGIADGAELSAGEDEEGWVLQSDSWDSTSSREDEPPPLVSLALVSIPLLAPTLFTLPPTLTSLALLSLPMPTPIHRLPALLPLLEVLDLSYNSWLKPKLGAVESSRSNDNLLERTDWKRWSRLRILGLRECGAQKDIVKRVNEGRWVDVEVIGGDDSY